MSALDYLRSLEEEWGWCASCGRADEGEPHASDCKFSAAIADAEGMQESLKVLAEAQLSHRGMRTRKEVWERIDKAVGMLDGGATEKALRWVLGEEECRI